MNHLRKPIRSSNVLSFIVVVVVISWTVKLAILGRLCQNYKKTYITVRMPLEERVLHPHQSWRERTLIPTSSCGPRPLPPLPVLQICPEMDSPQARFLCLTLLKTCSVCFNFWFVLKGKKVIYYLLGETKPFGGNLLFHGQNSTTDSGWISNNNSERKEENKQKEKKGRRKEREIEEGRKEVNVVVGTLVGKEFPDMRQNERRGEFIRVGDAQLKGEPLCELVANFYSLKTKKIPTGRVALGNWLGCYRVSDGWVFYLIFHQGTGRLRLRDSWQQLL